MEPIDVVRMKTADQSSITRETATGDGTQVLFVLDHKNIVADPGLRVFINNVSQSSGFTVDNAAGSVTFSSAPSNGSSIEFDYFWSVYSDEEIQQFLSEAGGDTDFAAAKMLLAWAANAARIAMRETLSGGGGMGLVTRDTSVAAKELRNTAAAFLEQYQTNPNATGAVMEGVTEIIWTDQMASRFDEQEYRRNW